MTRSICGEFWEDLESPGKTELVSFMSAICPQPKGLLMNFQWLKDKILIAALFMEDNK